MANKLKIAKVAALPVLSDTTATTNVITVDSTTGMTQGDRFVPASTVGARPLETVASPIALPLEPTCMCDR